jgi:hypothetical protein
VSNPLQIYSSRPIRPDLLSVIEKLKPGDKIRITQTVRVGFRSWLATVTGTFRHVDSLATGIATDRVPEDDIIVPILHFTKDNKEMSSIALDEQTNVELVS